MCPSALELELEQRAAGALHLSGGGRRPWLGALANVLLVGLDRLGSVSEEDDVNRAQCRIFLTWCLSGIQQGLCIASASANIIVVLDERGLEVLCKIGI